MLQPNLRNDGRLLFLRLSVWAGRNCPLILFASRGGIAHFRSQSLASGTISQTNLPSPPFGRFAPGTRRAAHWPPAAVRSFPPCRFILYASSRRCEFFVVRGLSTASCEHCARTEYGLRSTLGAQANGAHRRQHKGSPKAATRRRGHCSPLDLSLHLARLSVPTSEPPASQRDRPHKGLGTVHTVRYAAIRRRYLALPQDTAACSCEPQGAVQRCGEQRPRRTRLGTGPSRLLLVRHFHDGRSLSWRDIPSTLPARP